MTNDKHNLQIIKERLSNLLARAELFDAERFYCEDVNDLLWRIRNQSVKIDICETEITDLKQAIKSLYLDGFLNNPVVKRILEDGGNT